MTKDADKMTISGPVIIVEFTDGSTVALPIVSTWDGRADMMITKPDPAAKLENTEASQWGRGMLKPATNIASVRVRLN